MAEEKIYNKPKSRQDDIVQKEKPADEAVVETKDQSQRPTIEEPVLEKQEEVIETVAKPKFVGLDVGTNMIIASTMSEDGGALFKMQRDCYYMITPKSEVNRNSIKMSLDKRQANYFIDEDGSFLVVGEDALDVSIERNDVAERPLQKGVISPKNKRSLPILKRIIKDLVGTSNIPGSKIVYSIPGTPEDSQFNISYHSEIIGGYLRELGFEDSTPINEAFALGIASLLDDGLTGIACSFGAGMCNVCVICEGDPMIEFSLTKSGDFIDESVGTALDLSPSLIQKEKESGIDLITPKTEIETAIAVYYGVVIKYILNNIAFELNGRKKELPIFRAGIPIVLAGGLTLAKGFVEKFEEVMATVDFPLKISEVRLAESPLTTVANGCLMAAHL